MPDNKDDWPESPKSKKQLIYEMHFLDRLRVMEISRKLRVDHSYVSKIIKKVKEKANL